MQTNARFQDTVSEREVRNQAVAFEAAAEGIVLLENDGTLPISPCKLALYGAGAAYTIQGGSGSGEVTARHTVNALEGLEKAGFTITTKDWIERYDAAWKKGKEDFIREHRVHLWNLRAKVLEALMSAEYRYPAGDQITEEEILASGTDVCVYIVSRQSGEGYDRKDEPGSFRLTEAEITNIRICAGQYKRFVLVLNTGCVIDLSPLENISGINAIVYMNQLGMESGNALAAILTGRRTPSGKLAVTWAKRYADYPFYDEFSVYAKEKDRAEYKEGIYVGYRYFDSFSVKPRYPFGYGRSYTDFEVKTRDVKLEGTDVLAMVEVTNCGSNFSGKEVVQLYVSCPQEGQEKEYQRLAAFGKTALLSPGEKQILTLKFPFSSLSSYVEKTAESCLEAGAYILRVGTDSRDTAPAAKLMLSHRVVISIHRNLCKAGKTVYELQNPCISVEKLPDDLPVLDVDPDQFRTIQYRYEKPEEVLSEKTEEIRSGFAVEDMVKFCAGTGLFGENRGFCVPGAAGHTTTDYLDRGIPNRELCDGPAGIRVQRRSTISRKGKIKAVDSAISLYELLPGFITRFMLGNPKKEPVLYQNVTAFPVAAAVAQTWNTDLAEAIGRAVSTEMTEYSVTWWLAPALNIVRNLLCGRNYEYYSEDPLISGKFAAAVTRGVQETPGNYVTLKHFAANNQEENRYYVSSDLDERALREIYLRGFEIAVRESGPKAVMSAYNKINDVYCANNRELCTDILRCEWGFDGIVMTDWLSTGEDRADEAGCLTAGVNLIMPGGKKVTEALKKAQEEGRLPMDALESSCGRVLEQILAE